MISLILIIVAIVCLFLAALNVPVARVSIGWLGLAFYVLAQVIRV
jgi:hypothetical protein